jgi:hypothetical protein
MDLSDETSPSAERDATVRHHNKTFDTVEYAEYSFDTSGKRLPPPHPSTEPETKQATLEVDVLDKFSAAQDDANFKVEESARMISNVNKIISTNDIAIVEQRPSNNNNNNPSELERIQRECVSMVETIKALHEEEKQLREANNFLAHRAIVMGCTAGLDGGTRRGAKRKAAAKKAASTAP